MKHLITIIFLFFGLFMSAQQANLEVISSSGNHFENNSAAISWTLGEVIISTEENGSVIITQGFHQTNLDITKITYAEVEELDVQVYPNPVRNQLTIESKNMELDYDLIDASGKIILHGTVNEKEMLDMSSFKIGTYFINVNKKSTFKIIKK